MATMVLTCTESNNSTLVNQSGKLRLTYTFSDGKMTITKIEGMRNTDDTTINDPIGTSSDVISTLKIGNETLNITAKIAIKNKEYQAWTLNGNPSIECDLNATREAITLTFPSLSSSTTLTGAIFTEPTLTVNYYSNKADEAKYAGTTNTAANKNTNVKVHSTDFLYAKTVNTGLHNVQNSESLYLKKYGYVSNGYWNITTNGSGNYRISQDETCSGQSLATSFNQTLDNGNISINLYPEWIENQLTINYWSNYADGGKDSYKELLDVTKNVNFLTTNFLYDNEYSNGLHNYSTSSGAAYLTKSYYSPTGMWYEPELNLYKGEDENNPHTGETLANMFGLTLIDSSQEINLYAQWKQKTNIIKIKQDNSSWQTAIAKVKVSDTGDSLVDWKYCQIRQTK